MIIKRKTYNKIVSKYDELVQLYYDKDLECSIYKAELINVKDVLTNKKYDTPEKKVNRIKKMLRGKNDSDKI